MQSVWSSEFSIANKMINPCKQSRHRWPPGQCQQNKILHAGDAFPPTPPVLSKYKYFRITRLNQKGMTVAYACVITCVVLVCARHPLQDLNPAAFHKQ